MRRLVIIMMRKFCLFECYRQFAPLKWHCRKDFHRGWTIYFLFLLMTLLFILIISMWNTREINKLIKKLPDIHNQSHALTENLAVSHIFIVSAYYYPISKS